MKNILIIGAGPVGLYAWNVAGLMGLTGYIIDNNSQTGGQPATLYPNSVLYDIPGVEKITALKLVQTQKKQALNNGKNIELFLNTRIESITKIKNYFKTTLNNGQILNTETILFTTGNGSFEPNRLNKEWDFKNVFYSEKEINKKHKTIAVLGGGDSAISSCVKFIKQNKKIYLIHHRNSYRALKENILTQIRDNKNFKELNNYQIKDIYETDSKLSLEIFNNGNKDIINVDSILVHYGSKMKTSEIHNFGLKFYKDGKLLVDNQMQTNIEGIFAAGNIAYKEHKYFNIMSGIGETVNALYNISKYLNGEKYYLRFYSQK
ncbi:NAD(P)/FAD-dependent oxidoreductase [Spiroplasma endosymbiont of Amphibalanus improvisus]|uniref:NAD(P)/FAD-dependent oxidoreductase n=1 Tax=Spiroplasma endosymbiont of Amphibalanus improvisus TaxID=3066327 RepID=UPI00313DB7BD